MDKQEVQEVINSAIEALKSKGMLKNMDDVNYKEMNERLYKHIQQGKADNDLADALEHFKSQKYYGALMDYYKGRTLAQIAEHNNCDIITVWRNKKKLALELYNYLNEKAV